MVSLGEGMVVDQRSTCCISSAGSISSISQYTDIWYHYKKIEGMEQSQRIGICRGNGMGYLGDIVICMVGCNWYHTRVGGISMPGKMLNTSEPILR